MNRRHAYFTELTYSKALFYAGKICEENCLCFCSTFTNDTASFSCAAAVFYCATVFFLAVFEPFMEINCNWQGESKEYPNPDYRYDPCVSIFRSPKLLYFTREEIFYARRLLVSCILGGAIGWERRQADRPAGIRTMALVSLASCLFTCGSTLAFRDGPQGWDSSRVSAAIPSGVGFLGAGMIFKEPLREGSGGQPIVHGLTTAASIWMSAAVGIACGGGLYHAASFTVALLMVLLRFGPRVTTVEDEDDEEEEELAEQINTSMSSPGYGGTAGNHMKYSESQSLLSGVSRRRSERVKGPSLMES
jgi:uncharacterized membrane protein YhiD involved in acid resistance